MSTTGLKQVEDELEAHWDKFHDSNGKVQVDWFRERDNLQQKLRQVLDAVHFYEISEELGGEYDGLGDEMKRAIGVLLKSHNELIYYRDEYRMWLEDAPTP